MGLSDGEAGLPHQAQPKAFQRRRVAVMALAPAMADQGDRLAVLEPQHLLDPANRLGDWKNTHKRLRRWRESGVFERIFKALAEDCDNEYMMLDSTIVRAHQHSAGARKKGGPAKPLADPEAG